MSLWFLQHGWGSVWGSVGEQGAWLPWSLAAQCGVSCLTCSSSSGLPCLSAPPGPLSRPSLTPESLGVSLGERAAALPSWGPVPGSMGLGLLTAPAHARPSSPSPGAEWRQPPGGGVAGARQGRAPSPHEEQEIPGGAGGCREAPRGRPLPAGQRRRPGAGPPHGRRPLLGCRPVLQTWAGPGAHPPPAGGRGHGPGTPPGLSAGHSVHGQHSICCVLASAGPRP